MPRRHSSRSRVPAAEIHRVLSIMPKILENFGPNVNGTGRTRWKFSGQGGPPPEVVLFDRSVRSDLKLPFHFQKFSFPVPLQLVTTVKMVDGSDVSVY